MASNPNFVQYIADQCEGAGEIMVKKMFGDYGIYCDGIIFGLICDNCFYLKPTDTGRAMLRNVNMRPPYNGAKTISSLKISMTATTCRNWLKQPARNWQFRNRKGKNN